MKITKTLLASLLALATVATASAQQKVNSRVQTTPDQAATKIYITGSTAFRSATVAAITTVVGASPTSWDGLSNGVTSASNANAVTWVGGSISGSPVIIKASWSGSAAGVQTVAGSLPVRFLDDSAAVGSNNSDPRVTTNPAEVATPHVAMSDVFQGSTPFNGTFLGVPYNNLLRTAVGVVTFKWVASNGFPTPANATDAALQQLFSAGFAPLALFTGNGTGNGTTRNGDQLKVVYATGRNPDSGTRLTALADIGLGALATVVQYKPTVSGDTLTTLVKYPIETINGVSTGSAGNSGESSGSSLRTFMNKTLTQAAYQTEDPSATGGYMITYLGVSDANNVLPGGSGQGSFPAVELAFNGVTFSQNAVIQGSYGFWGYEHVMKRSNQTGLPSTFGTNLANALLATTTAVLSPNIALTDMAVSRGGDGTPIGPNYL